MTYVITYIMTGRGNGARLSNHGYPKLGALTRGDACLVFGPVSAELLLCGTLYVS